MDSVDIKKFFNEFSAKTMAQLIAGLATVAIASMDLGVDYNEDEKKVYTSLIFQAMAVFSVGYLMAEDTNQAVVLLLLWGFIKYRSRLPTEVVIEK
tara:strand:+ start:1279 stop:1566 length:288 start_codon:yes stop_codon:yes gene_type:complete